MGVSADLTAKAQLAFQDELKLWTRHGTWRRGHTMLQRDESREISWPVGADALPPETMTVERHEVTDDMVHDYLFTRAMEKALEAVQNHLAETALNAAAGAVLSEEAA
ncbi:MULTISPECIES: hypothetical protein [unclassified Bradyrhizobium]|uniref:hypothetical protein n=1 Tax=unclassified Bradyrhizobium TaxID=2631580 RepID=UPI002916F56C|nr:MULTISPECIES: hypothetical protein [unclassified Bradyrhizobium]